MALSEDGGRPSSMSEHDESPPEAEMENRALGGAYRVCLLLFVVGRRVFVILSGWLAS